MAIKTYANIIYREDEEGEKVPFKISAKTLILYKEYAGSDLISDMISVFNIKYKDLEAMPQEERTKLAKDIQDNKCDVNNDKMIKVMQNLILCARLAAYTTEEEVQEALLIGDDILPVSMLYDVELGLELLNLITKETKKKIK